MSVINEDGVFDGIRSEWSPLSKTTACSLNKWKREMGRNSTGKLLELTFT